MKNKISRSLIALSTLVGLALSGSAFAATTQKSQGQRGMPPQGQFQEGGFRGDMKQMPGIFGTVSAINGTNITLIDKGFGTSSVSKTYTVDASNATVEKDRATSTFSSISVGNTIMVQGTVSGTSVIATKINLDNGRIGGDKNGPEKEMNRKDASSTKMIEGNGQPVIGGTVTVVSGTTITITNKSNTNYTIDASNVIVMKGNSTSSVSNIIVGDSVLVQGTINGTSVVATTITDQSTAGANKKTDNKSSIGGFWGGIGNFFAKLFGF
jgi:hypothetical protein